jgi:hypothetical protein
MRGPRGQKGKKKPMPEVMTSTQVEFYSKFAAAPIVLTPSLDEILHDDVSRLVREQDRIASIKNHHARHEAEARLGGAKASLLTRMIDYDLPRREWDDGLCIEMERHVEERKGTVIGISVFRK